MSGVPQLVAGLKTNDGDVDDVDDFVMDSGPHVPFSFSSRDYNLCLNISY